jgi:hypothetical protein
MGLTSILKKDALNEVKFVKSLVDTNRHGKACSFVTLTLHKVFKLEGKKFMNRINKGKTPSSSITLQQKLRLCACPSM